MELQEVYQELEQEESDSDSVGLLEAINSNDLKESWGAVSNLDLFFQRLYLYYRERGFACILAKELTNVVTRVFVVFFSSFLLAHIDWEKLAECHDEASCGQLDDYLVSLDSHTTAFVSFIVLYFFLFFLWWLWTVVTLFPKLKYSWEMRQFYFNYLHITTRDLQTMKWSTVVERLLKLQSSGKYRIQINGDNLSAKSIAQRIMRKENYLVAMVNHEVLPLGSASCSTQWYLGTHLEKMIKVCVLDQLFDDRFTLKREFVNKPWLLRRRFAYYGALNFALLPFTFVFYVILFFLKYAEEFHSKQNYLGPRWYTPHALWVLREFNEVEHYFESRTAASVAHSDRYIKQFPTPLPTAIASGFSFILGSLVAILLIFTLLDDSILLHVTLMERNLLWYFAILSGLVAVARSFIPAVGETEFKPYQAMRKAVAFTHHMPKGWTDRVHTYDVLDSFSTMYQYKVALLAKEIVCIFTTPIVLCFILTRYASEITDFIAKHTVYIEGVGDVCVFSELNIEEHGNHLYGGKNSARKGTRFYTFDGKLEKSWLNFYTKHPLQADGRKVESGSLLDKLHEFQKQQIDARGQEVLTASMSSSTAFDVDPTVKAGSSSAFQSAASITMPLKTSQFQNAENYFYWLEEFRKADK